MTATTRQKLFATLMEGACEQMKADPVGIKLFAQAMWLEVEKIVPLIDQLISDREEELRKPAACGHPTACLKLAPFAEQPRIPGNREGFFIIDTRKLKYICSQCEDQKRFVRNLVEHMKKIFVPCGQECSRPTPADLERHIAELAVRT
jgi:hypothetical protein